MYVGHPIRDGCHQLRAAGQSYTVNNYYQIIVHNVYALLFYCGQMLRRQY